MPSRTTIAGEGAGGLSVMSKDQQSAAAYFAARAVQAKPGAFERVFGRDRGGGNEPPRPGDEVL